MKVDTHAFRDAFVSGRSGGYALEFDEAHSRAAATDPFLTRKTAGGQPCVFVFESVAAAEEERKNFPPTTKIAIKKVSVDEVRAFASIGYFGQPAVVFLRDVSGAVALL
jgi:hypothetical protein